MSRPGVTVGIPVYKDSILARYAAESVLAVADEVLVYRDGPQEDVYWPQFLAFASRHPKIRILEGREHIGYLCKNVLLQEATHTIVHMLDSDDVLNENYLDEYADALRLAEKTRGVVCLSVHQTHGDTEHGRTNRQFFDCSHSLAYRTDSLRWTQSREEENPEGFENPIGAPIFVFPLGLEVPSGNFLDYEYEHADATLPLVIHLHGIKENRLLVYRAVAYDFQRDRPGCSIDEYILRRASASGLPSAGLLEQMACDWLNEWGDAVPLTEELGKMPAVLERLRNVAVCEWRNNRVVHRDDSGWDPRLH